jgi:hypothetical protein
MAPAQSCLDALRAQYEQGLSDQDILYNICDYPSNEVEELEDLRCILNYGQVDINFKNPNENGMTPLMRAVISLNTEMVEQLYEKGANVMLTDNDGKTALNLAQEEREEWVNDDEDGNDAAKYDRLIQILTTYMQAAPGGQLGGKRTRRKQRLFNSPKGGPKTRGIKYATAANARKSIKLIRGKDKTRRKRIAMQMYYRAKYHKYQTPGMRGAMKVWKKYIDSI